MIDSLSGRVPLLDGNWMPGFGLGTFSDPGGRKAIDAVRFALDVGYRLVDTAAMYCNEDQVGQGVRESGVAREEIFVTTKIWPTSLAHVREGLEQSLRNLGMEYVDLFLMHWPGTDTQARLNAWATMISLRDQGRCRSIGVSNFYVHHLEELRERIGELPCVNQIECHPWQQQCEIRAYCAQNGIAVQAWGPLIHRHLPEEPLMAAIGNKYGKSAAQATLRWEVQSGIVPIPKSSSVVRIAANADIFDFELSDEDMAAIAALDGKGAFARDADTYDGKDI